MFFGVTCFFSKFLYICKYNNLIINKLNQDV